MEGIQAARGVLWREICNPGWTGVRAIEEGTMILSEMEKVLEKTQIGPSVDGGPVRGRAEG